MAAPDTAADSRPSDHRARAHDPGPPQADPGAATASVPGGSTPGAHRADHSTASAPPEDVRTPQFAESGAPVDLPAIPGYRVTDFLDGGGMAKVYRAVHLEMGRVVALKLIVNGDPDEAAARERFRREVQTLAEIEHPNIVPVYDAGDWQGFRYYTMKFVPRGAVSRHLGRFAGDVRAAATLVAKVARAVGLLHARGVMHRDLKPLNILLGENDEPLVADFGLARWIGDEAELTASGCALGTRPYMSPEQSVGSKADYTPACDIWALGVILFEVLTGRRPFAAVDTVELYLMIRGEPAPPASSVNPAVPPELDAVIARCLAKRPEDRYPTADALAADLEAWLRGEYLPMRQEDRPTPVRPRHHRRVVAALLAVVCAVLVGAVLWPRADRASLRTVAERVAAGESVTIIGPSGKPTVETLPVVGYPAYPDTDPEGVFKVTAGPLGMLRLDTGDLPLPVRIDAEVEFDSAGDMDCFGGLAVAIRDWPGATPHQSLVRFVVRKDQNAVPGGNVETSEVMSADATWWTAGGGNAPLYLRWGPKTARPANRPGQRNWHPVTLVVTPDRISGEWDRTPFRPIAGRETLSLLKASVLGRPEFDPATFTPPFFGGGIGLVAEKGVAYFRKLTLSRVDP